MTILDFLFVIALTVVVGVCVFTWIYTFQHLFRKKD